MSVCKHIVTKGINKGMNCYIKPRNLKLFCSKHINLKINQPIINKIIPLIPNASKTNKLDL